MRRFLPAPFVSNRKKGCAGNASICQDNQRREIASKSIELPAKWLFFILNYRWCLRSQVASSFFTFSSRNVTKSRSQLRRKSVGGCTLRLKSSFQGWDSFYFWNLLKTRYLEELKRLAKKNGRWREDIKSSNKCSARRERQIKKLQLHKNIKIN